MEPEERKEENLPQPGEDLQDRVQTEGTMYDPPADLLREAAEVYCSDEFRKMTPRKPHFTGTLRMQDGTEIEADIGQLTMGDMSTGLTATVSFEKPIDLSQAVAVLWGDVEIPLEQPAQNQG